jgi:DNA-binding NarL/FixJ family response regulator
MRVLIVDDHPMVRMGMRAMLENDEGIEIVGEAVDGAAAIAAATELLPDVVLMDLRMPGVDGVAATEKITRALPTVRVLVVTTYESDTDILRAIEAGASGYLLKDTPQAELIAGIRAAARGETVLAPAVAARIMKRMQMPAHMVLTPREVEVLRCVASGMTNVETGAALFIGESTVKTHLLRTFAKLGVDDRTAAVTVAMQRGILPSPGS